VDWEDMADMMAEKKVLWEANQNSEPFHRAFSYHLTTLGQKVQTKQMLALLLLEKPLQCCLSVPEFSLIV
jgi:hypothetical protein